MTEQNNQDAQASEQRPSDLVQDPGLTGTEAAPVSAEELASGEKDAAEQKDLPPAEKEQLLEALRDVVDPELGINVVDLGLVYGVHVDPDSSVVVDMTLTSAACPLTDVIEAQVDSALEDLAKESRINWVWMPPWTPEKITDEGREQLRMLGFNV